MLISYLPRFRRATKELDRLSAREAWSRTEIENWQLKRLNEVWQHAIEFVPHYRDLAAHGSLPQGFETLGEFSNDVPTLDKSLVRDNPQRFLSERPQKGSWHRTSGSTGKPTSIFWSHEAHAQHLCAKYRRDAKFGVGIFDRKAFVWGNPNRFAPGFNGMLSRTKSLWFDWLRNRVRLVPYEMDPQTRVRYVRQLIRSRCKTIYGYASAVEQLAHTAMELRVEFPDLKFVALSAEPVYRRVVELVEAAFGVPCVTEYGSVECGTMATEGPGRRLRVREDVCFLETEEQSRREHGIVVSVLNNASFPLLRYVIEDVTDCPILRPDTGFAELGNVLGRSNDFIRSARGESIHPMVVKHLMDSSDARRFQAKQHSDGRISLLLESEQDVPQTEIARIHHELSTIAGGYPVEVKQTALIQRTSAGKHRWIVSELASEAAKHTEDLR